MPQLMMQIMYVRDKYYCVRRAAVHGHSYVAEASYELWH